MTRTTARRMQASHAAHAAPAAAPTAAKAAAEQPQKLLWHLHGAVYDFEPFVKAHPGGEIAIRLAQGIADATATNLFASYHAVGRGRAWETLERFRVSDAKPAPIEPSAFRAEIETMLTEHFGTRDSRARGKASMGHACVLVGIALVQLAGWIAWAHGRYVGLLLVPLFHWLLAVNVSHDATHFAVSRSPTVNAVLAYAALPYFYGPVTWYSQHVVMHHTGANDVDADPDLGHFAPMKLHADSRDQYPTGEVHTPLDYLKYMGTGLHLCLAVPVAAGGICTDGYDRWYRGMFVPTILMPPGLARLRRFRLLNLLAPAMFIAFLLYPYLAFGGGARDGAGGGLAASWLGWAFGGGGGGSCGSEGGGSGSAGGGGGGYECFGFGRKTLFAFAPPILSSLIFAVVTQVSHVQPEAQLPSIGAEPDFFKRQVRHWRALQGVRGIAGQSWYIAGHLRHRGASGGIGPGERGG